MKNNPQLSTFNSQLPKGWEVKKLGDVCEIKNGGTPKTNITEYWDGNIKWITPKDMGKLKNRYVYDTPRKISSQGLQKSSAKQLPINSIILSTRAPIGYLAINKSEMATNQGCRGIIPSKIIDVLYLHYFLNKSVDLLNSLGTGTTFKELSTNALSSIQIPIPPRPEQQRIVEILDKAFVAIDKAKRNAEQNLRNAKKVFENYLQGVFENKGADWEEKRLAELCDFSSGGTPSKKNKDYWTGDIPWVSGRDMKSTRLSNSLLHISRSAVDESATRIAPVGTLLILVRGMGLAHGAQIAELMTPCAFNQDIKAIHSCPSVVPRYLLFALRNRINRSDTVLSNAAHGTLKIDSSELKSMVVCVPPLEYQQRAVAKIDLLTGKIRSLETNYKQKLTALAELKGSILQKAFRGEL